VQSAKRLLSQLKVGLNYGCCLSKGISLSTTWNLPVQIQLTQLTSLPPVLEKSSNAQKEITLARKGRCSADLRAFEPSSLNCSTG